MIALIGSNAAWARDYIDEICLNDNEFCYVNPMMIHHARFLRTLTKPASVYNGLLHNPVKIKILLETLIYDGSAMSYQAADSFKENFLDFGILIRQCSFMLPGSLESVTTHLATKCTLLIPENERRDEQMTIPISKESDTKNGRCLPQLLEERQVHHYMRETRNMDTNEHACRKLMGKFRNLGPGIITMNCPHGFHLGKTIVTIKISVVDNS